MASLTLTACSYDDGIENPTEETVVVTPGSADFSKYIALGNSLTSGYSDNALFKAGQENAFPNLLAQQFALPNGGGGEFKTPYMNDNVGGLLLGGNLVAGPRLIFNGTAPVALPGGVPTTEITNHLTGPFNNMGVPGAKSYHLLANGYGNVAGVATGQANPYFARFASSGTTSVVADAMAQNPTFFSLWIGNNDVLGYATGGGVGADQTGNTNVASYGSADITDPQAFHGIYNQLLTTLTSNGAKGVVANIPYVYTIPYFTTVPTHPLTTSALGGGNVAVGEATVDQLNQQLIGPIRQVLQAVGQEDRIQFLSKTTANPVLIVDETLTDLSAVLTQALTPALGAQTAAFVGQTYGRARHAKMSSNPLARDYMVLTSSSMIGTTVTGIPEPFNKLGVTFPMQDQWVLTIDETNQVKVATDAYNTSIKMLAEEKGLAHVDANAIMVQLANGGLRYDNYHMTAAFVQGGAFSLDGVHLTARANAYVANMFLDAIEAAYGAKFPKKKLSGYPMHYPRVMP